MYRLMLDGDSLKELIRRLKKLLELDGFGFKFYF